MAPSRQVLVVPSVTASEVPVGATFNLQAKYLSLHYLSVLSETRFGLSRRGTNIIGGIPQLHYDDPVFKLRIIDGEYELETEVLICKLDAYIYAVKANGEWRILSGAKIDVTDANLCPGTEGYSGSYGFGPGAVRQALLDLNSGNDYLLDNALKVLAQNFVEPVRLASVQKEIVYKFVAAANSEQRLWFSELGSEEANAHIRNWLKVSWAHIEYTLAKEAYDEATRRRALMGRPPKGTPPQFTIPPLTATETGVNASDDVPEFLMLAARCLGQQ